MTLATPWVIAIAVAAPVVVIGLALHDEQRRRTLLRRLGDQAVLSRVLASASPRRRAIKAGFVAAGLALVAIALARPQREGFQAVELRGLDLVVAIDVSKSMLTPDVGQTTAMLEKRVPGDRLGRARELAIAVIDELPGDRIAPIVFAGAASHFPLTEDHDVATRFLADLGPDDLPPGTDLGTMFQVATCLLRPDLYADLGCEKMARRGHGGDPLPGDHADHQDAPKHDEEFVQKVERGKAILVITDGGEADPETDAAVSAMHELGIAVFIVGVGSTAGGLVHETDGANHATSALKHDHDGSTVTTKRDDKSMRELATIAGDPHRYFADSEQGEVDPDPIVAALKNVNRGLAVSLTKRMHDVYQPFLFAGLMLFVIGAAIATRRRVHYPEAR